MRRASTGRTTASTFPPSSARSLPVSPEGFTDNSWSGLSRGSICYCGNCRARFKAARGFELPAGRDWNAEAYRAWVEWSYACRLDLGFVQCRCP